MEPSDEALLQSCRLGDADAWEQLVQRYQRLVYTIPRRAGLGEDLAAEVFQRVFALLVQKIGTIEQPERISAWLTTVAKRETWRVIQQEQRALTSHIALGDDEENGEIIIADTALPDDQVTQIEEQHQIRLAIQTLGERCTKLLTMLYYQDETPAYTEIAATLGISTGSIGPTRARCLEKLRRKLEEMGFE
ncbi:sigma-70 family RNA polymerase sigma factor [Chloroflexia bacterium SDU3-3]|nr:sigma-70 family RNA polymerase sigma factor [Chloroflexia bacterium SDU3-3]